MKPQHKYACMHEVNVQNSICCMYRNISDVKTHAFELYLILFSINY